MKLSKSIRLIISKNLRASSNHMKSNYLFTFFLFLIASSSLAAQNTADDFFRSTGKINTVLAVVLILFFVLIFFLMRLELKIGKLEKHQKDE